MKSLLREIDRKVEDSLQSLILKNDKMKREYTFGTVILVK